jgi:lysyl-tRNA synthetase class I
MADEYERLVSNPPEDKELSKKKKVARDTALGALRLSQVKRGDNPSLSTAGVSFRHLAMLAQIKSDDDDVWESLNRSQHLDGKPNQVLINRLSRMRNWIDSRHFPEGARIKIQERISKENKEKISIKQKDFLNQLFTKLEEIEWTEKEISESIISLSSETDINRREAYVALYIVILGAEYGPRIASIMNEIGREDTLKIMSKSFQ